MSPDDFARYSALLHELTVDFVRAVPDDSWDFAPDPPAQPGRVAAAHRIGDGFARGVYNAALATGRVDWTRKHEHYTGPLTRAALLAALDDKQRELLALLGTVDTSAPIDWEGTPLSWRTSWGL